jgi:hypothetical protein
LKRSYGAAAHRKCIGPHAAAAGDYISDQQCRPYAKGLYHGDMRVSFFMLWPWELPEGQRRGENETGKMFRSFSAADLK